MTREEFDFIGAMNMCDEISNEAYKKISTHLAITRKPECKTPCKKAIDMASNARMCAKLAGYYEALRQLKEWTRQQSLISRESLIVKLKEMEKEHEGP